MNYYVCLQIRICPNLKIFRHHEKPVRPYEQFSYVLLYSLKRNLFLKFLSPILSLNLDLNRYYCLILSRLFRFQILSLICQNLNWNRILILILHGSRLYHLREKLRLPYERFSYVQLYSWKQNLFLKFRYRMMTCLFLLILILRNFFLFPILILNWSHVLILHENHLCHLRK